MMHDVRNDSTRAAAKAAPAHTYDAKRDDYFGNVRRDVLPLLPASSARVLELGCGRGDTLAYLKREGRCEWAGGVELFPAAAAVARARLDWLLEGDAERLDIALDPGSLDLVLCLDVLEHLVDPWTMLRRLVALLRPGGAVVASIPNVRNRRVLLPLLFRGRFDYADEGLLDRTHLRFFTRRSAVELLESAGLRVDAVRDTGLEPGSRTRMLDALTLSTLRPLFTVQYLLRAVKPVGER